MEPPDKKTRSFFFPLMTLGSLLLTWIAGGVLLGLWVDRHWGLSPWGTVVGSLLGLCGAGYSVFREVRRMERD